MQRAPDSGAPRAKSKYISSMREMPR